MAGLGGLQVSGSGHLPASAEAWKDGSRTPWQAMSGPEGATGGRQRRRSRPASAVTRCFRLRE